MNYNTFLKLFKKILCIYLREREQAGGNSEQSRASSIRLIIVMKTECVGEHHVDPDDVMMLEPRIMFCSDPNLYFHYMEQ